MLPWVGRNLFCNNADGRDDGLAGIAMTKPLALYYLIQNATTMHHGLFYLMDEQTG